MKKKFQEPPMIVAYNPSRKISKTPSSPSEKYDAKVIYEFITSNGALYKVNPGTSQLTKVESININKAKVFSCFLP
jgi:hypothetical protein